MYVRLRPGCAMNTYAKRFNFERVGEKLWVPQYHGPVVLQQLSVFSGINSSAQETGTVANFFEDVSGVVVRVMNYELYGRSGG